MGRQGKARVRSGAVLKPNKKEFRVVWGIKMWCISWINFESMHYKKKKN